MTAAPHQLDPFATLLDQLADAPPCRYCGGYGGAHYVNACRTVLLPAFTPPAFDGAAVNARYVGELVARPADLDAAIEAHPAGRRLRSRRRVLQLVDTPLLREAEASVALDGDTHVVGEHLAADDAIGQVLDDAGVPRQLSLLDEPPAEPAAPTTRTGWKFGNGERGQRIGEAVLRFLVERVNLDAGADAWVEVVDLAAAYNRWAAANGEPADVRPRSFGMAMTAAGYHTRQLARARRRFYVYDGLALLPEVDEHLADDQPAPAPVVDQLPVPAPTAPPANDVDVDVVQLVADMRAAATHGGDAVPHGERPGRELPRDVRRIVRDLVALHGWTYRKAVGRTGKPRIYTPDGKHWLTLALTPSDRRHLDNLRAELRRMGAPL